MTGATGGEDEVICSSKGCRAAAAHLLVWNNPRLHTPDREKLWAACPDHRDTLGDFLNARGFLRRIDPYPAGTHAAGNPHDPDGVQSA
ncbi:MAG TPA: hypothetical protein VNA14_00340 [Mycobacteriales bacterium]|nr:hypothetical protein [Mycobacteriales bacterium]